LISKIGSLDVVEYVQLCSIFCLGPRAFGVL